MLVLARESVAYCTHFIIKNSNMRKILDILAFAVLFTVFVYVVAFATVGACIVSDTRTVAECRNNVAGELVYQTVNVLI